MSKDQFPMNAQCPMLNADADAVAASTRFDSLSLHRMRGEGRGEGFRGREKACVRSLR
ncbi:MAG: hypothetical protein FD140_2517 [Limisphaerales bacterium]|nr:MAG: hypothetical protein FD140_2517 [Limisphaerales bacterium]